MGRLKHTGIAQFKGGLSVAVNNDDGILNVPVPTSFGLGWKEVYEGFDKGVLYTADTAPYWNQTVETTGTTAAAAGGLALLPKDDTDNSSSLLQWTTPTLFPGANTKQFYFETRVTLTDNGTDMDQYELLVGFTSNQSGANLLAAAGTSYTFDDGFGFGHLDGDTTLSFVARQSDVEQRISFGEDLVSDVPTRLGVWYDGVNYNLYFNGVLKTSAIQVVYNDDAATGMSLFVKNGETKTKDLLINYVYLASEL